MISDRGPRGGLVLGLVVLVLVAGYVLYRVTDGGDVRPVELLVFLLGGLFGATFLGASLSTRLRGVMARYYVQPSVELLVTYAFFGILLGAIYGGYLEVGVISALLFACGVAATLSEDVARPS